MTSRIYRYEVPVDDKPHIVRLSSNSNPLHVSCRFEDVVEFWALNDDVLQLTDRAFMVVGTGHELPYYIKEYHGTAVTIGATLVWHLIEVFLSAVDE